MRQSWIVVVLCAALVVAGCSWPPASQVAAAASPPGREIVIECRDVLAEASAPAETALKEVAPAAVGLGSVLLGSNPIAALAVFMGGTLGIAIVEQAKGGTYELQHIRVPVPDGAPSCTVRKADGAIVVLVGGAAAIALDDGMPDGLAPEDAALWRRMMGALAGGATPQPEGVSPQ